MAAHRKFTFDNPEDSYWNANGPIAGTLFDEIPSTSNAAAARAALDDLFETQVRFGSENDLSIADIGDEIGKISDADIENQLSSAACLNNNIDEKSQINELLANKLEETPPKFQIDEGNLYDPKLSSKSAASIVSEGSVGSFSSEATTQLDYSRLKNEHRKLLKHLEVRLDRYRAADAEITIKRLSLGDPVTLDLYRSKKQKSDLLDAAIECCDGDVIIAVLVFLEKSLNENNFLDMLTGNDIATNHYLGYLKEIESYERLIETYINLGRFDEAAMVNFAVACKNEAEERIQNLKKGKSKFRNVSSGIANDINECIDIIERQMVIEATDAVLIKEGKTKIFQQFPKTATLIGRPVLTTLYYSCLYHYDLPMNAYASPLSLKQTFQVTEKQYIWMAVSALSRLKRWDDVELVLTSKKLLGGVKIVSPFPWCLLLRLITSNGEPPKELMCKILRAIPDLEERRRLASEFTDTSEILVECLVAEKDRVGLTAFLSKLTPHTIEARKAITALNSAANKWKN